MSKTCVKCGYIRQATDTAPDYECPKCGVIYAKAAAAQIAPKKPRDRVVANDAPDFAPTSPGKEFDYIAMAESKPSLARQVSIVVGWVSGAVLLAMTIWAFYGSRGFTTLIFGLLAVSLCLPPTRKFINKVGGHVPGALATFALVLLPAIAQFFTVSDFNDRKAADQQQRNAAENSARLRLERAHYFEKNKSIILADIQGKIDTRRFNEDVQIANLYSPHTSDPDLAYLRRTAVSIPAKEELSNEVNLADARRLQLYTLLGDGDPAYAKKRDMLKAELQEQSDRKARDKEIIAAAAIRNEKVRADMLIESRRNNGIADCYDLHKTGDARGDNSIIQAETIGNAKRMGLCEDKPH